MRCPRCNNEINDNSRFCSYCGAEFIGEEEVINIEPENTYGQYGENPTIHGAVTENNPQAQAGKPPKNKNTLALQLIITLCVLLLICGILVFIGVYTGKIGGGGEVVTDAAGEEIREGRGTVTMSVKDIDGTVRTIESDKSLVTPEAILKEYTAVMNQLKSDSPGFTKTRYQNLPTDHQSLGSVGNIVLPIIEKYVTSKNAVPSTQYNSGNADKLPVIDSVYGCLLTDSTKIKNAYTEILGDDEYKIVITVKDEINPTVLTAGATTTDSAVNGMFNPYEPGEIISAIADLAMSNIDFTYTDCTATVIYNYETKQVQSLNMTMNIDITADTLLSQMSARIVDITEYSNFVYM